MSKVIFSLELNLEEATIEYFNKLAQKCGITPQLFLEYLFEGIFNPSTGALKGELSMENLEVLLEQKQKNLDTERAFITGKNDVTILMKDGTSYKNYMIKAWNYEGIYISAVKSSPDTSVINMYVSLSEVVSIGYNR
jgi:hypothetical protein